MGGRTDKDWRKAELVIPCAMQGAKMKIIPYTKKGKTFNLVDEFNLPYQYDGIIVQTESVKIMIREIVKGQSSQLDIEIPNEKVMVKEAKYKDGNRIYNLKRKRKIVQAS